jgi:hypothetical protein
LLRRVLRPLQMLGKPVPDLVTSPTALCFHRRRTRARKPGAEFHRVRACARTMLRRHVKQKNMYRKKVRGIERSSFVLDRNGVLARESRAVKVPGHLEEVLNFVKAL